MELTTTSATVCPSNKRVLPPVAKREYSVDTYNSVFTYCKNNFELHANYIIAKALKACDINDMRHKNTNYDYLLTDVANARLSARDKELVVRALKNFVNSQIHQIIVSELIKSTTDNTKLVEENNSLKSTVEELTVKLKAVVDQNTELSVLYRTDLMDAITSKEEYIQVIAGLLEVSLEDAASIT